MSAGASQVEDARQRDNINSPILTAAKEPAHADLHDGAADVSEAKASLQSDGNKTNVAKSSSEASPEVRAQLNFCRGIQLQNLTAA